MEKPDLDFIHENLKDGAKKFTRENFTRPTAEDYFIIENAYMKGAALALAIHVTRDMRRK